MTNLWLKVAWVIGLVLSVTGISKQLADACQVTNKEEYSEILVAQGLSSCQKIAEKYQDVYVFETQNFYINICSHNQKFYYHRKSKQNPTSTIFLPADNILNSNIFQAVDRGKIYIVGNSDEGYYSSVMDENNQVIFEPELKNSSTLIHDRPKNHIERYNSNHNKIIKCSQEQSDNYTRLFSWQHYLTG